MRFYPPSCDGSVLTRFFFMQGRIEGTGSLFINYCHLFLYHGCSGCFKNKNAKLPQYHGTTQNRPRASWCVTNTDTQTITPLRRCRLNLSLRLSARHTTRTRRDPRRAPRPRHAHRPLAAPAGQHARSRARRNIFPGRRCRVVVGGAFRTFRNYLKCRNQPKIRGASPRLGKI